MMDSAKFLIGQIIEHRRFGYRGVIVDVDPSFQLDDEWYDQMASSKPPKDRPWYHVLPDNTEHMTYVAERNLTADASGEPVEHPALEVFFEDFENGRYVSNAAVN